MNRNISLKINCYQQENVKPPFIKCVSKFFINYGKDNKDANNNDINPVTYFA